MSLTTKRSANADMLDRFIMKVVAGVPSQMGPKMKVGDLSLGEIVPARGSRRRLK